MRDMRVLLNVFKLIAKIIFFIDIFLSLSKMR